MQVVCPQTRGCDTKESSVTEGGNRDELKQQHRRGDIVVWRGSFRAESFWPSYIVRIRGQVVPINHGTGALNAGQLQQATRLTTALTNDPSSSHVFSPVPLVPAPTFASGAINGSSQSLGMKFRPGGSQAALAQGYKPSRQPQLR